MSGIYPALAAAIRAEQPVALISVIDGPGVGKKLLVRPEHELLGSLGNGELDRVRGLVVTSSGAHSSVAQAGQAMDVDVVNVPADGAGRMHGAALRATIEGLDPTDRQRAFAIVATSGTTNAGVIVAPPVEIRRSDATRSASKSGSARIWEKKIGGAPMNETCSASMRSSASAGFQVAISTDGIPAIPGTSTPFRSPATCARGAGMSTASSPSSPCTDSMLVPL